MSEVPLYGTEGFTGGCGSRFMVYVLVTFMAQGSGLKFRVYGNLGEGGGGPKSLSLAPGTPPIHPDLGSGSFFRGEKCRRRCLEANWTTFPQKWPPPPPEMWPIRVN